jgi:acetyl-CoA acetyltransferase
MNQSTSTRVAVIGGARTPFARAGTVLKNYSALQLGVHAVNGLLEKQQLAAESVEELVYGIVLVDPRVPHFAREVNLHSALPASVRALTVTNNCITGASAITAIYDSIVAGRAEVGIAGGAESMSHPALLFSESATRIFVDAANARSFGAKLRELARLRPWHFKPRAPAIAEPSTGLTMGEHTELMVKEWKISREEQDEVAHIDHDPLIRPDTTVTKLTVLSPVFDRSPAGTITAGNASPLTDGAAAVLLMSEERARKEGRAPLAFIKAFEYVGIDPADGLLMSPGIAVPRVLRKTGLKLSDMDIVEMHEAFAGQVACNLKAWENGWKEPAIGKVDPEKLNPLGSSIAVGHPFAATGARIVTTIANEMKRRGARYGLVSICGAGATAVAMILERN